MNPGAFTVNRMPGNNSNQPAKKLHHRIRKRQRLLAKTHKVEKMNDTDRAPVGRQPLKEKTQHNSAGYRQQKPQPAGQGFIVSNLAIRKQIGLTDLNGKPEQRYQNTRHQAGDSTEQSDAQK